MSIAGRFAIIFSFVVLLATTTVGLTVYRGARKHLIRASTDRLEQTADVIRVRFYSSIEAVGKDARFLAETPPTEGLMRLWNARRLGYHLDPETAIDDREWRDQLANLFSAFLESRPTYDRISFVGVTDNGRELVRVERKNNEIVRAGARDLVREGEKQYFQEVVGLPRDEVYISSIALSDDPDEDPPSLIPTLRVAVPVYDTRGDAFGAMVIDVDLRYILRTLQDLVTSDKSLYLATQDGDFVVPMDRWPNAGGQAGRTPRIQDIFPDARTVVSGEERKLRIEETRSASGVPISAYFERMFVGTDVNRHLMLLGITSPHAEILAGVRQVRDQSFFITLLFGLGGIALALIFSRYLTSPLLQITHALSRFGKNEWKGELPVDRADEIGMLARTYVAMSEKIQEQVIELEQEEQRQRTILETSAEGIVVTNEDGVVETFNPAAEKILGYSAGDAIGKNIDSLIRPGETSEMPLNGSGNGWMDDSNEGEAQGIRLDGEVIPLSLTYSSFDLNGQKKYTIFFQDISERKIAEEIREKLVEELEKERARLKRLSETLEIRVKKRTADLVRINKELGQRNRELQDFAYVASHDLQEPLRKIRAFADLLQTEHSRNLSGDAVYYIQRMYDAAERMSQLITDLLAFSHVTSRGKPYEKVDLGLIVREVLSDLEVAIAESNAEIIVDDLPTIEADPSQMRQLFQNLIGNAIKFRKPDQPPIVQISSKIDQQGGPGKNRKVCQISVKDNGTGFDQKYVDRIFSPFQRLHPSDTYEGTGMGLSICRRIVERHEGSISATSQPGEGAEFVVSLPVQQRQNEIDEPIQSSGSSLG